MTQDELEQKWRDKLGALVENTASNPNDVHSDDIRAIADAISNLRAPMSISGSYGVGGYLADLPSMSKGAMVQIGQRRMVVDQIDVGVAGAIIHLELAE
jgi:hypothetical protein